MQSLPENLRVAVIHDWLTTFAGSEKVLECLLQMFPGADLFVVVDFLPEKDRRFLEGHAVTTSFIQKLPLSKRHYRQYLPLMPLAVEQFDLKAYDLVISSSHAVAKGVITSPDQLHVSYVHSPMRYAWDMQSQYFKGKRPGLKTLFARMLLHYLRIWDRTSVAGVDTLIANSTYIARRIEKVYRRTASVVYPPVDIDGFTPGEVKGDFYLAAGRMVPYKRFDLIVEAFSQLPDLQLVIIGDGPEYRSMVGRASPNVRFLGYQGDDVLKDHLRRAKAFIFAAEEDFGILPVEAMACGTPVIAFGRGGSRETVVDINDADPTGIYFMQQTPDSLMEAVMRFEVRGSMIEDITCRRRAEVFSRERFKVELYDQIVKASEKRK